MDQEQGQHLDDGVVVGDLISRYRFSERPGLLLGLQCRQDQGHEALQVAGGGFRDGAVQQQPQPGDRLLLSRPTRLLHTYTGIRHAVHQGMDGPAATPLFPIEQQWRLYQDSDIVEDMPHAGADACLIFCLRSSRLFWEALHAKRTFPPRVTTSTISSMEPSQQSEPILCQVSLARSLIDKVLR